MPIRYPDPLQVGDTVAVTAPSSGVAAPLRPRLDFCVQHLRSLGYAVVVGTCMDGTGVTSAPATERAAELQGFLCDPEVRAVVPPWGGELAIDLVRLLDFDAIGAADPTWLVGYSDLTTVMLPLTLRTGIATLHGPNLMDTAFDVPEPLLHWLRVASAPTGSEVRQGASAAYQGAWGDFRAAPQAQQMVLDRPTRWRPLVVYLEVAEADAPTTARMLHALRLAGWFDHATGILIGRTSAPDSPGFTQVDAVAHALADLGVPVVVDVDLGHVPPQLALVNGALADVEVSSTSASLAQRLG